MKITANNPNRKSWLAVEEDSDFPIQNIPFGVFLTKEDITTIGTRIGNYAIDLAALQQLGYFEGIPLTDDIFMQDSLNDFIADGRTTWRLVRNRIADIFDRENTKLKKNKAEREVVIFDIDEIENQYTEGDMLLTPDFSSATAAPWTGDITLQIIHDVTDSTGKPMPLIPRNVLKRVLSFFEADGLVPVVAPEMEFFLVARNTDTAFYLGKIRAALVCNALACNKDDRLFIHRFVRSRIKMCIDKRLSCLFSVREERM